MGADTNVAEVGTRFVPPTNSRWNLSNHKTAKQPTLRE